MTFLDNFKKWLEKTLPPGYHKHEGYQEHPVRVKDHSTYFSTSHPRRISGKRKISPVEEQIRRVQHETEMLAREKHEYGAMKKPWHEILKVKIERIPTGIVFKKKGVLFEVRESASGWDVYYQGRKMFNYFRERDAFDFVEQAFRKLLKKGVAVSSDPGGFSPTYGGDGAVKRLKSWLEKAISPGLIPRQRPIHLEGKIFFGRRWMRPERNKTPAGIRIPPAWKDVWVTPDASSPLQAVGKDAAGRTQYLYSKHHSEKAAAEKFKRLKDFNKEYPKLLDRIIQDARGGKEEAIALYLIAKTGFRVGSEKETRARIQAFGVTTLRGRHLKIHGDELIFNFIGKKGAVIQKTIKDKLLGELMGQREREEDEYLFSATDGDVRKYFSSITSKPFKVKDFRTRLGTATALQEIKKLPLPDSPKEFKQARKQVAIAVSEELGNTPAIALSAYIAPEVFAPWEAKLAKEGISKEEDEFDDLGEMFESVEYDSEDNWEENQEITGYDPDDSDDFALADDNYIVSNSLLENAIFSDSMMKAVVPTPTDKEGKFDKVKVRPGDAVWITVTNPESPLSGRHILIVKRPDGLFALAGGAGMSPEVAARKHVVLTGTPKRTRRDEELIKQIDEAEKANEPIIVAKKELESEARAEVRNAANAMQTALGIEHFDKKQFLAQKDEIQNYVASKLPEEEKERAKSITDAITRQLIAANREVRERVQRERQVAIAKIGKRLAALREGENAEDLISVINEEAGAFAPTAVNLLAIGDLKTMTPEQAEQASKSYLEQQVVNLLSGEAAEIAIEKDAPKIELGTTIKPFEIKSEEQLKAAIDNVKNYWEKRNAAELQAKEIKKVPLKAATPMTIAELKQSVQAINPELSADEVMARSFQDLEIWSKNNSTLAFYDTVAEYWNDNKSLADQLERNTEDTALGYHLDRGAAVAIAALSKQHTDVRLDTLKLIKKSNVEMAAASLALHLRQKYADQPTKYSDIVEQVKAFNAKNQTETEQRALEHHKVLSGQFDELQRQKTAGEFLDKIRISSLETDNLLEQRKNLGSALGSLQASATFYDFLERLKTAKTDAIKINIGANLEDAQALVEGLKLKHSYAIDTSDPDNIVVKLGLGALDKHIVEEKDSHAKQDLYEKLKTNMDDATEDEAGNIIAKKYDVPFWKKEWEDESGASHPYHWRVEQRNDINWLLETTKEGKDNPNGEGGGLITRVTGAGKTNTALGFFAHKLSERPEYRGIIVVPKGRAEQWLQEAQKFTTLSVEIVPDGTAKEEVSQKLLGAKKGSLVVMGHREAARSHEILLQMQNTPELKFDGIVIDEPQELQARGQSGNIGELGKRIMRASFRHRIGLTATPARRSPLEVYDLIKWTSGKREIGSKASFNRIFSGFGSGTNAQDTAIRKLYFDTIRPYISGDRITVPDFKVTRDLVMVNRSSEQITEQKRIEGDSAAFIAERRTKIIQDAKENPNHPLRRLKNWEAVLPRKATELARREVELEHRKNLDNASPITNSKFVALRKELERDMTKKHVIYIDSGVQRATLAEMFRDMGLKQSQIKNIAAGTTEITGKEMAQRVQDFRMKKDIPILLIDKTSAVGYNLQIGNYLHVIGAPIDAANYMQAQGRLARMPRKGDVSVKTYRYSDNPTEAAKWNDLDNQIKLLQAASPGLFVGKE